MLKKLSCSLILLFSCMLTACGWHFQNTQLIPPELQTLSLASNDPYSEMAMVMRKQLLALDINLVEPSKNVAVFRINKITTNDEVASIFKRGREAEKVLMLNVEASIRLSNGETYPIEAKVNRTFFDNSRAALAKSAEREVIWKDMRQQAARQLISKMIAVQHQLQGK